MIFGRGPRIFISYRRSDSADVTGRIFDRLQSEFGRRRVFKDVDSIPFGVDFGEHIRGRLAGCDVALIVIGPAWVTARNDDGNLRLDDPADYVRIEAEEAMRRGIPVVPILVGNAPMPRAEELPGSLGQIRSRNALPVRPDPDFHRDMDRLIRDLGERRTSRQRTGRLPIASHPSERTGPVPDGGKRSVDAKKRPGRKPTRFLISILIVIYTISAILILTLVTLIDPENRLEAWNAVSGKQFIALFVIFLSSFLSIVSLFSLARRPWAIATGAFVASAFTLTRFGEFANRIVSIYGDPISEIGFTHILWLTLFSGVACIPPYLFRVLGILDGDAQSSWIGSLAGPIVKVRPGWIPWVRRVVVSGYLVVVAINLAHAVTTEVMRRAPLSSSEAKLAGRSWRFGPSLAEHAGPGTPQARPAQDMVWTFRKYNFMIIYSIEKGKPPDRLADPEGFDHRDIHRWAVIEDAPSQWRLVLSDHRDGRNKKYYYFNYYGDSSIKIAPEDGDGKEYYLSRVEQIPFGQE